MPYLRMLSLVIVTCFAEAFAPCFAQVPLTGDMPFIGDRFGQSVAIHGNIAVVGAPGDETNGDDSGAAYIFENKSGTWDFLQKLTGEDLQAQFGFSVAVVLDGSGVNEGDFVAVGSLFGNGAVPSSGTVTIYRRLSSAAMFEFQQTISAPDGSGFDEFGYAIALDLSVPGNSQSGDPVYTLAAGAPDEESAGVGFDHGAVYLFQLSPDGTAWASIKKLVPDEIVGGDYFGRSVHILGDVAVAGAVGWPFGNHPAGAAYLIRRFNDTGAGFFNWEIDKLLKPSDGESGDRFGTSVSVNALGTVVVGAPNSGASPNGAEGAAYLFKPVVSAPFEANELIRLPPPDPQSALNFGSRVATDGAFIAVSDPEISGGVVRLYEEQDSNQFSSVTTLQSGDPGAFRVADRAMALDAFNVIAGGTGSSLGGMAFIMTDRVFSASFEASQAP